MESSSMAVIVGVLAEGKKLGTPSKGSASPFCFRQSVHVLCVRHPWGKVADQVDHGDVMLSNKQF